MINVNKTSQYTVNPKGMISDAFESAYSRYAEVQVAAPPDTATMVCSVISLALICIMLAMTAVHEDNSPLWFILAGVSLFGLVMVVKKYLEARKAYLAASGKPDTINTKRNEFFGLFGADELPTEMPASEFQSIVSPLLGKQYDTVSNNALRSIKEDLVTKNNPDLPMCKLITPMKEIFTQSRRRLYLKEDGKNFVFFDADWMNPIGEIICTEDDVVSFGKFSQYPASINACGGKIRPDSVIVEIQDDANHIYIEFQDTEYERVKKIIPGRKEKK